MTDVTQESRTKTVGVAVTPTEHRRIALLAAVLELEVSGVLRRYSVDEAVRLATEYREQIPVPVTNGDGEEAA